MRVLAITNMYPHAGQPTHGVFVEQQVLGLRRIGLDVDVLFIDRVARGMRAYFEMNPAIDLALRLGAGHPPRTAPGLGPATGPATGALRSLP